MPHRSSNQRQTADNKSQNDGNYVFAIFSGFQRFSSGICVIDARTDEPIGYLPSAGGHHDCVIVPRNNAELANSQSTTL
jgi:thiocyanate desulfurase